MCSLVIKIKSSKRNNIRAKAVKAKVSKVFSADEDLIAKTKLLHSLEAASVKAGVRTSVHTADLSDHVGV